MSDTKKVVHLTTVHHPLDPRIYYKQCLSLKNAGYDVTLIATEGQEVIKESIIKVISLKKYRNRFQRMIVSTIDAYKKARKINADFYHIHDPELLPVAWVLKKKGNIVIYDIHEDYETSINQKEYIPKLVRKVTAKMYSFLEKALSTKFELCLAEKYYQEKYPKGVCILNYPLLNEKLINHQPVTNPVESKVIYTGNITVDRGALIHAKLPLIHEDLSVEMIGKCPQQLANKMFEIVEDKKNHISIEGIGHFVPKDVIEEKYVNTRWLAGIALFPPTEHYMKKELTKFFEYMSAGIPILCSDFPIWKGFVEKYNCGIAVNPNDKEEIKDAIQYLLENENEALQMGNNGKEAVVMTLNWKIEEAKLITWYEELGKELDLKLLTSSG
ncbi:glycosyltransferase [Evansella tamaricis]|uniref:Glycosyltransferase n=1 Tax=Evansella tamaricis TaxID=2069301 RepID=A0ABS6JIB9_9BACI|nr:glycosyltransferase [Evansella tamaricis]MBU9712944.1 glycosyltransferase [Evansella tamaricis]